jgi:hypothetical protein
VGREVLEKWDLPFSNIPKTAKENIHWVTCTPITLKEGQ